MANKQRGEVEVKTSDGSRHVFKLGSGAICQLEESLKIDILDILRKLEERKVPLRMIREFVKAGSLTSPDMSDEQANVLIDDVGVVPLLDVMADSIVATFNVTPTNGNGNGANPSKPARKKRGGAGTSSEQPSTGH